MKIRRLEDGLVDQIAAGEVVERPASVVKELVENALDAGAQRIRVEVRGGGADLVAVTDDGSGMAPDDARLALERHATSKLRGPEDLSRIHTFGFRGEALPAIASVSRFRLRTLLRGASEGCEVRVEEGRLAVRSAGGPAGTRVEVADLFSRIPARRKFLKSAATEWGHSADWLGRVALALPQVHFEISRDDRATQAWPATGDPLERIAAVLSEGEAASLIEVEQEEGRATVRGFFSRPDAHRPTAKGVHLYVNGRPIRDRLLRHAVLDAYRDILPRGRFPTALIFLTVPASEVDVNVHPAKWEVRFADPRGVHQLVVGAGHAALGSGSWYGGTSATGPLSAAPPNAGAAGSLGPWRREGKQGPTFVQSPGDAWSRPLPDRLPLGASTDGRAGMRFSELRLLGQLLGTYLVLEQKEGLLLVDQHAAHERVLYERLRAGWLAGGVTSQALLVPEVVELGATGRAALEDGAAWVEKLGFEVESFDERSVAVRTIPALLSGRDPATLLRELADSLEEAHGLGAQSVADSRLLDAADRSLATLACHAARTAGEVLDPREQRELVDSLDTIPWAPTCPHGRPVAIPLPLAEIERRFGRR